VSLPMVEAEMKRIKAAKKAAKKNALPHGGYCQDVANRFEAHQADAANSAMAVQQEMQMGAMEEGSSNDEDKDPQITMRSPWVGVMNMSKCDVHQLWPPF